MGFQAISQYNAPPLFQMLIAQKKTTQPVFAFKLATIGSELYLGGVNNALYTGSFTYVRVSRQVSTLEWPQMLGLTVLVKGLVASQVGLCICKLEGPRRPKCCLHYRHRHHSHYRRQPQRKAILHPDPRLQGCQRHRGTWILHRSMQRHSYGPIHLRRQGIQHPAFHFLIRTRQRDFLGLCGRNCKWWQSVFLGCRRCLPSYRVHGIRCWQFSSWVCDS